MGNVLVIRADADAHIGSGHLMRCLALAQAWQDRGGQAVFVTACDSAGLRRRLEQEGFPLTHIALPHPDPADWQVTSGVLQEHPGAWVALDGYHFDPAYQRRMRQAGHPLLVIDDTAHHEHYYADIVLNQNLHAHDLHYPCEPDTQLLLGTKYVLLRREFLKWRGWKREIPEVARKLLVTMGGGDPENVTLKVLGALDAVNVEGLEVVAVVGASNLHLESLQAAAHSSRHSVRLISNPGNMAELMAWADFAISAAGSTCWELAFMGLPSALIPLSPNQKELTAGLAKLGLPALAAKQEEAVSVGHLEKLIRSPEWRATLSIRLQRTVSGYGAQLVATCFSGTGELMLRPVTVQDTERVWQWANDPETRKASFTSDPIPWETHTQWFESKLRDPASLLFIGLNDRRDPIGIVRFEVNGEQADISVNVAPAFRSMGWGKKLIRAACQAILEMTEVRRITAHVKPANPKSRKAFTAVGFTADGSISKGGQDALRFVLTRKEGQ